MNKFKKIIVYFLDVIGVLALVLYGMGAYQQSQKPVEDTKPSTVTVIKEKLGEIAELNTASYVSTSVLNKSDFKQIFKKDVWGTKRTLVISYDSTVKAGIKDLTQAEVTQKEDKVLVILPEVEITGVEIDNDSFQRYDESDNAFNPVTSDYINEAQQDLKDSVEERAIEKGLLDLAKTNAEKILKELLGSPDGEYTVEIQWKEA
ncbi:MAG: DUF4230 domain-containing protein [Bulleidia sp.]|nr:DUF4230 domain-containing protein [Bulleidia sp.]